MNEECIKLFKCLADKSRLKIISSLMDEPMYVELLAERLGLASSTISFHLKKMEAIGLVHSVKEQYYIVYHLNKDILSSTLNDLIKEADSDKTVLDQREIEYREKVIKSFFEYGKLKSIPVQRKKRAIVLEKIAESFEPKKEYTEREVNIIIADFNDDFCTIRREMIANKIMERENGIYQLCEK